MHTQMPCSIPKLVFISVDILCIDPIENPQLDRLHKSLKEMV